MPVVRSNNSVQFFLIDDFVNLDASSLNRFIKIGVQDKQYPKDGRLKKNNTKNVESMCFGAKFNFKTEEVEYELKNQNTRFYCTCKLPRFEKEDDDHLELAIALLTGSGIKTIRIID